MSLVTIAARNILRNKLRTMLTIFGAAIAVLSFVALRTVLAASQSGAESHASDRLVTRHKVSYLVPLPKRYFDAVRAIPGVQKACYLSWFGGTSPKQVNTFFASMAMSSDCMDVYAEDMIIDPSQKQAWLSDRRGAILGDQLARMLGVSVGDKVTLNGSMFPGVWEFNVAGVYKSARNTFSKMQFMFHWDYLNDSVAEDKRDQIGWILSSVDRPEQSAAVSAAIDRAFDDAEIQTTTMSERALGLSTMATFSALLKALDIVSVIIMVIMMLILGNTLAMSVRERTREFATLRALGFEPRHIRSFIVGEAAIMGVLASVVGLGMAYPMVQLGIGRFLQENVGNIFPTVRISPGLMALATGITVALAIMASLVPAYQISRLQVVDALRRTA